MSPFPQSVADSSTFPAVFLSPPGIIKYLCQLRCSEESPMATLDLCIKCPCLCIKCSSIRSLELINHKSDFKMQL